jgi:hypothetical protein
VAVVDEGPVPGNCEWRLDKQGVVAQIVAPLVQPDRAWRFYT